MDRKLVLDLSKYDKGIDLAAWVEERGLWGVIIKACGNEGGRYVDPCLEEHYRNAKALGLKIGYYSYTTSTYPDEARKDAQHILSLIEGKQCDLPVYIDVEDHAQLSLNMSEMTSMVEAWCQTIESSGKRAGIYSGVGGFSVMDDSVCKYSLWLAYWADNPPKWFKKDRGYDLWQQGGMRIDGHVVYGDASQHHDFDWWYEDESQDDKSQGGGDMRERILEKARGELGVRYWSMHEGPRGSGEEGWGCAMFCMWLLNELLGTHYYGSCYNVAGECLGASDYNQGNTGEFEFIPASETEVGDFVLYSPAGYTMTDSTDFGHIAMLSGNGMVIGAMGRGVPGASNYLNIGIKETTIAEQSLGGGHKYVRCTRLDKVKPKEAEPIQTNDDEGLTMNMLIHPSGENKIYYWDGSPETVPFHVSPKQKDAIETLYRLTNGRDIPYVEVESGKFDEVMKMCKARMTWREGEMVDKFNGRK